MNHAPTVATAALNKQLLLVAYAEVAKGNTRYIRELYADDITWFMIGTTKWSKKYIGKQAIIEMFDRLYALFTSPRIITEHRFIAEGDLVVVECRGETMTRTGKPYNNTYCMIYRLANGKITEVTEYCDTALIDAVL